MNDVEEKPKVALMRAKVYRDRIFVINVYQKNGEQIKKQILAGRARIDLEIMKERGELQ